MSEPLKINSLSRTNIDFERIQREGIDLDKGVVLTTEYLEEHEDLISKYMEIFTAYPDVFLDLIKPVESNFELFFY
jgi:hypothetical protein